MPWDRLFAPVGFRSFSRPVLLTWVISACCLLPVGCGVPSAEGPADTYFRDFSMPPGSPQRGAIIFLIDGVNATVFQRMLDAGELPAFKKYFIDRGLYCPRTVCSIPSITLVNETSVVTGVFPGHHGVIGNNWFDRNQLIWRNYAQIVQKDRLDRDYDAPTIYEQFPDELTCSLFYQAHRGATQFVENWTSAGPPFFFGWYEFVDRLTLSRFDLVMDTARKYGQFPAVTTVYLLAADFGAYGFGVGSPRYRAAMRHTDRQIGRVLGDIERAGLLDKIVITLISDHGLADVKRHFPIRQFLGRNLGLDVASAHWWENDPFEERLRDYEKSNAVLFGSGERYGSICLRRPIRKGGKVVGLEPWLVRPTPEDLRSYPTKKGTVDLLGGLIEQEAVDALAYKVADDRVRVLRKTGEVEFRQAGRNGPISCHVIAGTDPLGWQGKVPQEALSGKPVGGRQWLKLTIGTDFPDLPEQILVFFHARKAGDIAVFAAPGWDLNSAHKAGHGGLRPGDMVIPMVLAGPGVPHGQLETARSIDLMPTLLTLLGRKLPANLDGVSLLQSPTATQDPEPQRPRQSRGK